MNDSLELNFMNEEHSETDLLSMDNNLYTDGQQLIATKDLVLTAQWIQNKFVLYNSNTDLLTYNLIATEGSGVSTITTGSVDGVNCKKFDITDSHNGWSYMTNALTQENAVNFYDYNKLVIKYKKMYSSNSYMTHAVFVKGADTRPSYGYVDYKIINETVINNENKTVEVDISNLKLGGTHIGIGMCTGINSSNATSAWINSNNAYSNGYNGQMQFYIEEAYLSL